MVTQRQDNPNVTGSLWSVYTQAWYICWYCPLGFIHLLFSQTSFICPVIQFVAANTVPSIIKCRQKCVSWFAM